MSSSVDELLEEAEKSQQAFAEIQRKQSELVHVVFSTDHGQKLLKQWADSLFFKPTLTPNSTEFEAGIEEGKKEFVRQILLGVHMASQTEESPSIFNILR